MIWRLTYYTVMACWLLFIAFMLSDHFPQVFMNPIAPMIGVGILGLLMIFKPWKGSDRLTKREW